MKYLSILFLLTALAVPAGMAGAQEPAKVPRIGVLLTGSPTTHTQFVNWLREGMKEHGYVDGRDYQLEARFARRNRPKVGELARELVRRKVDVIVPMGLGAAREAAEATRTIPIVVGTTSRILGTGLVRSLTKPGGNVTGMTSASVEISTKRLQLLAEVVPGFSRVALAYEFTGTASPPAAQRIRDVGKTMGIDVRLFPFKTPNEFLGAFSEMKKTRTDALIFIVSRFTSVHRRRLINLANEWQIPAMCWQPSMVRMGCLMSYGSSRADIVRRSASFVVRILRGAKPADLPIERPTRFYLTLNLRTAKAIGVTFPASILLRADNVIE